MKHFDHSRLQKAFEQTPSAFHDMVAQTLCQIKPERGRVPSQRRVAILAIATLVCLISVATAVIRGFSVGDS